MQRCLLILLCACALFPALLPAQKGQKGLVPAGQKILWLGDSITQAGDYVTFAEYYLNKQNTSANFDFVSIGLSSENVSCLTETDHPFPRPCLSERLRRALDLIHPRIVIACYGMNDGIYHPQSPERMAAFQKGIRNLIEAVRAKGARLILLTPPPFDASVLTTTRPADAPDFSYKAPYEKYDDVLADYSTWEKTLAASDVSVVDLHTPIHAWLAKQHFTKDGIHPDPAGHLLMARIILNLPQTSLNDELARIQNDPLYVLVKSHREKRSQGWLDAVGYTRDKTVKIQSPPPAEEQAQQLQTQIDLIRR